MMMFSQEAWLMEHNDIRLELRLVKDIRGNFIIPSYQRGYRWGTEEVRRLLDDVHSNGSTSYCLQPIVVKRIGEDYELIDGQQRLTTIYLIYAYMHQEGGNFIPAAGFTLTYSTRKKSKQFLEHIDLSLENDNVDFWFMAQAYREIERWFKEQNSVSSFLEISSYFEKNVKVIWYEVGSQEDAISLFTRLNIGKIPLTSSELVKAMFLKRNNAGITNEKKDEIALQWDSIERELHDDRLWYFLSNQYSNQYQTRIDLVLNLMAAKDPNNREKYYTYFYFDSLLRGSSQTLIDIWRSIQHTFLMLKDWYENHELYHKIGYLIASSSKTLQQLYADAQGKTKDDFIASLDGFIKESIRIDGNYADLSYEKQIDYQKISKLLLLFNVESVRRNGEQTEWFPFAKYKFGNDGTPSWSLEHIHAQQSEGMKTQEIWKEWLKLHVPSIRAIGNHEELIKRMEAAQELPNLTGDEFRQIQSEVIACLSVEGNTEYLHSIANLALLNSRDNAALNNSTFDVKRNRIIEFDKQGIYIPFCTRMVFLKYYSASENTQLHFWGQTDRIAYIKEMNRVLHDYLGEEIQTETEGAQ